MRGRTRQRGAGAGGIAGAAAAPRPFGAAARTRSGAALVMVLAVSTLICLVVLALAFTVTLDSLAARNAQQRAIAGGQAEGALALAAMDAYAASGAGGWMSPPRLGPWPDSEVDATVAVSEDAAGALWLTVHATTGRVTVSRRLILAWSPDEVRIRLRE